MVVLVNTWNSFFWCFPIALKKSWQVASTSGEFSSKKVYLILFVKAMSLHLKLQKSHGSHTWVLDHNNAPAHTALSICQFLTERNIATLEHPHIPPIWSSVTLFSLP